MANYLGHVTYLDNQSFIINIGHVTQQGKQNGPIGDGAILHLTFSLDEIIL